jgi:hypothetical protein
MDFDHVRGKKLFCVGSLVVQQGVGRRQALEEIAKCDVVCANCHRLRTSYRRNHMQPTTINPYYVVYRDGKKGHVEYFTSGVTEDDKVTFTERKAFAMLFTNLQSAARVASAEVGMIRALVTKDEASEFGFGRGE